MKKTRKRISLVCLLLVCTIMVSITGCSAEVKEVQARNLMESISANHVDVPDDLSSQNADVTDFAVRLFKAGEQSGKNTLISPLSVLCALTMTANGAEGETRKQMEAVLGMTAEELNLYLYNYRNHLPQSEKYKLSLANSIWFTEDERFTVNPDFLQTNADYYNTDIYKAPFNDGTCNDINNWVKEKTDEMIPEILDRIPQDAVMYLVNALAFEAEWSEIYEENQVRKGQFTREDGTGQDVDFMYSTEGIYLEDEKASGFVKYYNGGKYAFAALLPNEGISVSDYIASLDGQSLHQLLTNPAETTVQVSIPKFETEYDVEMSDILKEMGMPLAFDEDLAEFGKLGSFANRNIAISRVLHKTFISVGEKGTKAGAATIVEMIECGATMPSEDPKEVYLDRPFVYMLIDCENNIPFFMGTMMDVEE